DPDGVGSDVGEIGGHPFEEAGLAVAAGPEERGETAVHDAFREFTGELVPARDLRGLERTLIRERASFDHSGNLSSNNSSSLSPIRGSIDADHRGTRRAAAGNTHGLRFGSMLETTLTTTVTEDQIDHLGHMNVLH